MQRYHVDAHQARRVATFAATLYEKLAGNTPTEDAPRMLGWAARLHEIGIPVAYSGYHKHSAYIVSNADMPGFSRDEQERLASLVLSHRRSLKKSWEILPEQERAMVLALRLAVVLCRARRDTRFPPLEVKIQGEKLRLAFDAAWLEVNPLTATALREEIAEWIRIGHEIRVPGLDDIVLAQEPVLAD
jgi:exopolyphosphatase/guanosine-5'-triphosphate,3'-diphosphate pyrophosphatase